MDDQTEQTSEPTPRTKTNTIPMIGLIVAIFIIGGGILLLNTNKTPSANNSHSAVQGAQTTQAAKPTVMQQANEASFMVTGANFSFDPKEIKVKKGTKVTIIFKNAEGFHDINIDEFNAHSKKIPANAQDTITFTADKTGTFQYYCSVGSHRAMGMVGNLTVE